MKYSKILSILFSVLIPLSSWSFSDSNFKVKPQIDHYRLAVMAVFQDEAPYLKEWIEFHRQVGVEHFYLYNNFSVDGYKKVLKPYIDEGLVELIDWPYESHSLQEWNHVQCKAYMHSIKLMKGHVDWAAFIDVDEFMVPIQHDSLIPLLDEFDNHLQVGGIGINWVVFGTSNVEKIPDNKLLIETLLFRAALTHPLNKHIKSIVRPHYVTGCQNPHFFYHDGSCQMTTHLVPFNGPLAPTVEVDKVRINHYLLRDEYFYQNVKEPRRKKWGVKKPFTQEELDSLNRFPDETMQRFVEPVRTQVFR